MKISTFVFVIVATLIVLCIPVTDGRAQSTNNGCCDPADEPGLPGNQPCVTGHTCCSNGELARRVPGKELAGSAGRSAVPDG
jgi:hypothetical protein